MFKVKFLQMHTDLFLPGLGTVSNTLPPQNKTIPGLTMTWLESGAVRLDWTSSPKVIGGSAIIAAANVKACLIDTETPAVAVVAKK